MTRNAIVRFAVLTATLLGLSVGCSAVYVPSNSGWCKEGREWVPPTKKADLTWKDGYCREKQ